MTRQWSSGGDVIGISKKFFFNYVNTMHKTSQRGFIHSVKVPRIYKVASVIVKKVVEEGGSLKDLVYSSGHKNIKGVYALVVETIKHSKELDKIIKSSKLLAKEPRLQPWLARILITELLYGKKELKGESKPVQTILNYKEKFERLNNKKDLKISNVTVFSTAMLVLPLVTFFAVKNILDKEFHITGFPNTAWSVISAVIVVNLIIMAYAWKAYTQEVEEEDETAQNVQPVLSKEDLSTKKPRYVRVNTLFYTPDEVIKVFRKEGWTFLPVPSEYSEFLKGISQLENYVFTRDFHIKELLVFPESAQFYENELYQNGSILLQDKASCLPAFLLKPKPDSVVLDMCAAPGMKTTHLSAIMKNKGKIYASEIDSRRFKVLCDLIHNSGCTNVTTLNIDALNLNKDQMNEDSSWIRDVEYILVDPSCSGSGMVDRVNIFKGEKNDPKRLKKLCGFQFKLLKHALTNFPKVKRVVYSTCSVESQENEKVVEDVLEKLNSPDSDEEKIQFRLAEPLKDSWPSRGSAEFQYGNHCLFSDPKKDLTNGFFVAVFERLEETAAEEPENIPEVKGKGRKRELENDPEDEINIQQTEKHKKKKKKKHKENSVD